MKFSTINSSNIRAFLEYFANRVGKSFDEDTYKKWESLDDDKRNEFLNRLMESFGYDKDFDKMELVNNFLNQQKNSPKQEVSSSKPFNPFPRDLGPEPEENEAKKSRRFSYWLGIVFLILFLVAIGYIWTKYSEYNNRDRIYCLASNLTVRKDLSGSDKWPTRMDLFGEYMTKDGDIYNSYSSLPLVDEEKYNEYYKVFMDTSFIQYLTSQEKIVGYVHSDYVTTSKKEYDTYKDVFRHFSDDYNELQHLAVRYRRIIVNTIMNSPNLNGKSLSPPCYKDKSPKKNPKTSIATIKDPRGLNSVYYVIARIDGQFYTMRSNPDATDIELAQTKLLTQSGETSLSNSGKFGPRKEGGIWWYDCKSDMQAYVTTDPYEVFREKGLKDSDSSDLMDNAVDFLIDNLDDAIDILIE